MISIESREPEYGIDPQAAGLENFSVMVYRELCTSGQTDISETDLGSLSVNQILHLVSRHCGNESDYLEGNLPIRTKIFRLLLIAPSRWVPESEFLERLNNLSQQKISKEALRKQIKNHQMVTQR